MDEYILFDRLYRRDWIFESSSYVALALRSKTTCKSEDMVRELYPFYLAAVAHFARWISRRRIGLSEINKGLCERFISSHLPRCSCPPPRQLQTGNMRAALKLLQIVLAEQGFAADEEREHTPVSDEVEKFHRRPGRCT